MAAGEITIWAPVANGPTPGPVTLMTFGDRDGYQRSTFGQQVYEQHTPFGTAVVSGAYWRPKYTYAFAFTEQDVVYRGLRKLMLWQQMEVAARRAGRLSLRDEAWEFEPEPPPHSLSLLNPTADADTWVRGFGTIPSVLIRSAQGPDFGYAGYDARSLQPYKLFQIEVTQL